VLWKRPREPSDEEDGTVCNVDLVRGLRDLAVEAAAAEGDEDVASGGMADVRVYTAAGDCLHSFRALLAASSPTFRAMFSHNMKVCRLWLPSTRVRLGASAINIKSASMGLPTIAHPFYVPSTSKLGTTSNTLHAYITAQYLRSGALQARMRVASRIALRRGAEYSLLPHYRPHPLQKCLAVSQCKRLLYRLRSHVIAPDGVGHCYIRCSGYNATRSGVPCECA
jgi:hypothetical protein